MKERQQRKRPGYVNVALWTERSDRHRNPAPWRLAGPEIRAARRDLRKEGYLPLLIPIGAMSPDDQVEMSAHLARYGIDVPDGQDDAAWS